MSKKETWWKTFDYRSGRTYILGKKFSGKTAAMAYAEQCGMVVIPQSTRPLTDEQKEIAILKDKIKEMQLKK